MKNLEDTPLRKPCGNKLTHSTVCILILTEHVGILVSSNHCLCKGQCCGTYVEILKAGPYTCNLNIDSRAQSVGVQPIARQFSITFQG